MEDKKMKKMLLFFLVSLFSCCLVFGAGSATAYELSLQEILDGITVGGNSSVNAETERIPDELDSYWYFTGNESNFVVTAEYAGSAPYTTFGIYLGSNSVEVFSGPDTIGDSATVSIMSDGSVWLNGNNTGTVFPDNLFGFYFTTPQQKDCETNCIFYTDTGLNIDGFDHIVTLQGKGDIIQIGTNDPITWKPNEFILALEDYYGGGDGDYNDMVVFLDPVYPKLLPLNTDYPPTTNNSVPEPSTLFILGSGLVGLAFAKRKMNK